MFCTDHQIVDDHILAFILLLCIVLCVYDHA